MDPSKVFNGVGRCALLFTGLLGVYVSHKRRIPEYMAYVSWYITCIGLGAVAQYLIEGQYKESEEKDKDSQTPTIQEDKEKSLIVTKKKLPITSKMSREEFDKEVDKILLEINSTDSANIPRKIRLPNLEHFEPEAVEKDHEQLVEPRQAAKDEIILRTSPIKMKVLNISNQNLDIANENRNSEDQQGEYAGNLIDQLRLRQIIREPNL